ncbi:putative casein kinase II beta chain [Neospora caninum Liverpool]|uniref:Casein kinase II subunit beta n=1 Tax=Neospora caninum (strain Liverpool) TaxID=572307 RepID=F0VIZ8_NEOCL|nr:putative casein kinase II beta chain [Neospora caninum Liverpool]CBZ53709.1 putative casein kinase II beta chain [Neospora caninum Liverpool]CEL67699.1 TPA: casein kinase II beta chain, putative [Neospora caninum Liverpool]|eukprot:XP_003883741.1 putative casein kinase II beta chain [Neospora caninum Liverpool]
MSLASSGSRGGAGGTRPSHFGSDIASPLLPAVGEREEPRQLSRQEAESRLREEPSNVRSAAVGTAVFTRGSEEEDDEEDGEEEGETWISWFCALEGHECFSEVDEEYIKDTFNLFGLKPLIGNYDAALDMILGAAPDDEDIDEQHFLEVYRDAMDLYGLIHSRYVITPRGLAQMREKYISGQFGECPRVLCDRHPVLPLGISPDLSSHRLRLYCPLCQEAYDVREGSEEAKDIDGAFFGPSFPHIFLQTFPNLVPLDVPVPYQPKIFGFRVHNRKSIVQLKLERGEYGVDCVPAGSTRPALAASAAGPATSGAGEEARAERDTTSQVGAEKKEETLTAETGDAAFSKTVGEAFSRPSGDWKISGT